MYLFFGLSDVGMAVGVGVGVGVRVVGVEVEGEASVNCSNNCWQSLIWDFKFKISLVDMMKGKKLKTKTTETRELNNIL